MGYIVKVFDTRYDPQHAWTTLDNPNDVAAVSVAMWKGANAAPPRLFAVDGGADGAHGNALQMETPAAFKDTPAAGGATVAVTAKWLSNELDMGLPGRDKRVHLFGCKSRNLDTGATTAVQTVNIYTSGSSAAAQTATETLTPTTAGDDWNIAPSSGDVAVSRTEAIEQLRSELFQMQISCAPADSSYRIATAELYYTIAG